MLGKTQTVIMMSAYGMVVFGNILLLAVFESASVTSGLFIDQQKKNLYSIERDDANARLKRACSLRPFDVSCHGYCPRRSTNDMKNLIKYRNCTEEYKPSTFHCAKNESGKFVEACAVPTDCYKGTEPILNFEKENKVIANVRCEQCSDDRFNPFEAMKSDEYSVCPYARRICRPYYGLVECDIVAGEKRTWTDSKCRCNITGNFLPQSEGPNNCTDDDDFRCFENRPCPDTMDGRKQEYMYMYSSSKYTCVPKCGEGYHPRTLDRDQCIPIVKSNDTSENNTLTAVSITTSPQVSVENVTEKVHTPPDETKTTTDTPTKGKDKPIGLYVIIAVVVIIVVLVGMFCYFRKKKKDRTSNPSSSAQYEFELEGLNPQGQSSYVDVSSSPPESGDNTDHREPDATSQDSQEQSTHVDVHSSPTLSENDTDQNEPGATRRDSQGQSSCVDVPSSPPVSGDNTDHNKPGVTSQDSQTKLKWIEDLLVSIKKRKLTNKDLTTIPEYIGDNWEAVAYKMGQSPVDVHHIKADNRTEFLRIHTSIHTWKTKNIDTCTVENFLKILNDCSKTTIEWQKLKTFIENLNDDNSSVESLSDDNNSVENLCDDNSS